MHPLRKLLILGVNELVSHDTIELAAPSGDRADRDNRGYITALIAGRDSIVQWSDIGFGELRISVWWDYDHSKHPQAEKEGNYRERFLTAKPLARRARYKEFVGATVSGWLERKEGVYLQGRKQQGIFATYIRSTNKEALDLLKNPIPLGYAPEGPFHM